MILVKDCIDNITPCSGLAPRYRDRIKKVVEKLANSEISNYISDILTQLLLVVPADIPYIDNLFNKFDKNFIVDCSENEIPHFLDIKVLQLGLKEHPHWLIG